MGLDEKIEAMQDKVFNSGELKVADANEMEFKKIVGDIVLETDKYGSISIPRASTFWRKSYGILRRIKYFIKRVLKKVLRDGILRIPILGKILRNFYHILYGNKRMIFTLSSRVFNDEVNLNDHNEIINELDYKLSKMEKTIDSLNKKCEELEKKQQ